jgi:hypothetical protein
MKLTLLFLLAIILIVSSGCTAVDNFVDRHASFFEDYEYSLHGGTGGSSGGGHSH